eukprot:2689725-Amphidinium_carterae.1
MRTASDQLSYPCPQAVVTAGIVFYAFYGLEPAQTDIDTAVDMPYFEADHGFRAILTDTFETF